MTGAGEGRLAAWPAALRQELTVQSTGAVSSSSGKPQLCSEGPPTAWMRPPHVIEVKL